MATITLSTDEEFTVIQVRRENFNVLIDFRTRDFTRVTICLSKDEAKSIGNALIGTAGGLNFDSK